MPAYRVSVGVRHVGVAGGPTWEPTTLSGSSEAQTLVPGSWLDAIWTALPCASTPRARSVAAQRILKAGDGVPDKPSNAESVACRRTGWKMPRSPAMLAPRSRTRHMNRRRPPKRLCVGPQLGKVAAENPSSFRSLHVHLPGRATAHREGRRSPSRSQRRVAARPRVGMSPAILSAPIGSFTSTPWTAPPLIKHGNASGRTRAAAVGGLVTRWGVGLGYPYTRRRTRSSREGLHAGFVWTTSLTFRSSGPRRSWPGGHGKTGDSGWLRGVGL